MRPAHIPLGGFVFLDSRLDQDVIRGPAVMPNPYGDADLWRGDLDRRKVGRRFVSIGSFIIIPGRVGVSGCIICDLSARGVGVRTYDLAILPVHFGITFDNFRTTRACRLIWRAGDYLGLALET